MVAVKEGRFSTGLPYVQLGQGPPLVVASGLSSEHANPTGMWRRMSLSWAAPLTEHFTVYLINRKPGLAPDATLADIAADYAGAIDHDIGQPVLLHGTSTGVPSRSSWRSTVRSWSSGWCWRQPRAGSHRMDDR